MFHYLHSGDDKRIIIVGPDELFIEVDHDDVNPETVEASVRKMVYILNAHWVNV